MQLVERFELASKLTGRIRMRCVFGDKHSFVHCRASAVDYLRFIEEAAC